MKALVLLIALMGTVQAEELWHPDTVYGDTNIVELMFMINSEWPNRDWQHGDKVFFMSRTISSDQCWVNIDHYEVAFEEIIVNQGGVLVAIMSASDYTVHAGNCPYAFPAPRRPWYCGENP